MTAINESKLQKLIVEETITITSVSLSIKNKISDYTLLPDDYTVKFDCTNNPCSAFLPISPEEGKVYNITKSDDTLNILTIDGNGKQINGNSTISINSIYTNYTLQYDGTEWIIL